MKEQREIAVGAHYAKTHFSELLDRVARGEEVTITRYGTPLARLVPLRRTTRDERARAIEEMRNVAARNTLGGLDINKLKAAGRR